MYNFDVEDYMLQGRKAVASRNDCEVMAETLHKRGYSNIVLMGVGGTTAKFMSLQKMIDDYSDVETLIVPAGEILASGGSRRLTKNSLVITGSKSGDTKEVVEAVKKLKEAGIETCSITGNADTPLAQVSTYNVYCDAKNLVNMYLPFYYFLFKLLELRGDFPDYQEFADEIDTNLHRFLVKTAEEFDPRAKEWVHRYHKEPYQVWVGSGEVWGDVYMFTMCVLEEMQWIPTKCVTSPEFFHGTLELYDEDTLFVLVKGTGKYRMLDERVEKFLKKVEGKHIVLDLADFSLKESGIKEKYSPLVDALIMETVTTNRLAAWMEYYTGHNANFRRYYRQFEY